MKKLFSVIVISLFCALFSSCDERELAVDTAEVSFRLENPGGAIYQGEELTLCVVSNHPSFKFVSFEFPLCPDLVVIDKEYSVTDNKHVFSVVADFSNDLAGEGNIVCILQDIATGKRFSFDIPYVAYLAKSFVLSIDNAAIKNEYDRYITYNGVSIDKPVLVGGDDLVFSIVNRGETDFSYKIDDCLSNLDLKKFESDLILNETCTLTPGARKTYTFHSVTVDSDFVSDPGWIKIALTEVESGRSYNLEGDFFVFLPFTATASLDPDVFHNGESVSLVVSANRASFVFSDFTSDVNFGLSYYKGRTCNLNEDGEYIITKSQVTSAELGKYTLSIKLFDVLCTQRTVSIDIPYEVVDLPAPSKFNLIATRDKGYVYHLLAYPDDFDQSGNPIPFDILSNNSKTNPLLINEGESIIVQVQTDEYVQKKFSIRNLSPNWNFATVKDKSTDGSWSEFEIYGSTPRVGGVSPIEISVLGNESVVDTFYVQTRYVASFELGGEFYNQLADEPCAHFNENQNGRQGIGWIGVPKYLYVRCVTVSKDIIKSLEGYPNITNKSLKDLKFYKTPLTAVKAPTAITHVVQFNCSKPLVSAVRYHNNWDEYRYGGLLLLDRHTSGIYCENGVHHNYKRNGAPDSDYPLSSDYPGKMSTSIASSLSGSYSGASTIAPGYGKLVGDDSFEFNQVILGMNNNCWYEIRHNALDVTSPKHNLPKEEFINVFISSLSYDHKSLFIPFIIYTLGPVDNTDVTGNIAPWWWDKQEDNYKGFIVNPF